MDFTSKNIITTAAVTAALLPAASFLMQDSQIAYADSVEYRVVTGDYVNFRKGPSTSYASLGQLNKGDKVEYFDNASKALGIIFFKFDSAGSMNRILQNIDNHIRILLK